MNQELNSISLLPAQQSQWQGFSSENPSQESQYHLDNSSTFPSTKMILNNLEDGQPLNHCHFKDCQLQPLRPSSSSGCLVENDTTCLDQAKYLEKLEIKKNIVKLKQSKSKKFVKRNFIVSPLTSVKLVLNNRFVLYNYMEIEGLYSDLDNDEQISPFDLTDSCTIYKLEISQKEDVTLYTQPNLLSSGLKEFQFLIDHFEQLGTPIYLNLARLLRVFQQECRIQTKHLQDLKHKIQCRIIGEEQVVEAGEEFRQYVKNYIDRKFNETDFVGYCIFTVNPEEEDVNITSIHMNQSFLSLMGVDIKQYQSTSFPDILNLCEMLGLNRIKQTVDQILLFLGNFDTATIEQNIVTVDNIKISTKMEFQYINWPDRPSWMGPRDMTALSMNIIVGIQEMQAILKIREDRNGQKQNQLRFDQQVQREIFIEKFYPEIIDKSKKREGKIQILDLRDKFNGVS